MSYSFFCVLEYRTSKIYHCAACLRVWIDESLFMLIQMEEYDSHHRRKRRLSVKKIKKISDIWMVKDMEVRSYPSKHRTLLCIDDIPSLSEKRK